MSFLGKLLYKYYYRPIEKRDTIKRYGGKIKYTEMLDGEAEMRNYAFDKLAFSSPFNNFGKFKLNFLTGEKFIHQTLFCIYSFSKWLTYEEAKNFSISLYDDKSLKKKTIELLKAKFPQLQIFTYNETVEKVKNKFPKNDYPYINKKITELFFFNKLFFLHSENDPGLKVYLDSDMLFVNRPSDFLNWLTLNYGNSNSAFAIEDIMRSYGYDQSQIENIAKKTIDHQINAGFYGLHTKNVNFDEIERLIKDIEENYGSSYYMEQFITSLLLTSQKNLTVFPRTDYIVWPSPTDIHFQNGALHHYVDISKYGYFTKAWKKIIKNH
ncbi:hypothetical protein GCM10022246_07800 [Pedobacter ginsengiterrae]|uniref:Glycosyl transferase n=1 Tax=Pedobacter ginsengiterrae TaxID=871696 RepID=A0ABP7NYI8_9SPHI